MSGDRSATGPDRGGPDWDPEGADARVARAAAQRRRVRTERQRQQAEVSMWDVLVAAGESGVPASLRMADGRSHVVRVEEVGSDVVVSSTDRGRRLLIGHDAIRSIHLHGSGEIAPGIVRRDQGSSMVDMADILSRWVASAPRISVWGGGEVLSGTLIGVGSDCAVLATDGGGETAYVRLDSVTEISVSVSSSE